MLKETETEETLGFFVTFLSLVMFALRGAPPLATPMLAPLHYVYRSLKQEVENSKNFSVLQLAIFWILKSWVCKNCNIHITQTTNTECVPVVAQCRA